MPPVALKRKKKKDAWSHMLECHLLAAVGCLGECWVAVWPAWAGQEMALPRQSRRAAAFVVTQRASCRNLLANPFNCNCQLAWLGDWLRKRKIVTGNPRCQNPDFLRQIPLQDVAFPDFRCEEGNSWAPGWQGGWGVGMPPGDGSHGEGGSGWGEARSRETHPVLCLLLPGGVFCPVGDYKRHHVFIV